MLPGENLETVHKVKACYLDMVRFTRSVIGTLRLPKVCEDRLADDNNCGMFFRLSYETLIPHSFNTFWSEHSERAVLNTWAATLWFSKDERDKLGRW
eukprot:12078332-Karenia_brevis.AAC.1